MNTGQIVIVVLALLNLILLGIAILLWARVKRLREQVAQRRPTKGGTPEQGAGRGQFATTLRGVELKKQFTGSKVERDVPEKYRYAAALAERGFAPEEVAAILHLPQDEAEQLVVLSRIAKTGGSPLKPLGQARPGRSS